MEITLLINKEFKFLIGRLKLVIISQMLPEDISFKFLIGRLKQEHSTSRKNYYIVFKFLIGGLKPAEKFKYWCGKDEIFKKILRQTASVANIY